MSAFRFAMLPPALELEVEPLRVDLLAREAELLAHDSDMLALVLPMRARVPNDCAQTVAPPNRRKNP